MWEPDFTLLPQPSCETVAPDSVPSVDPDAAARCGVRREVQCERIPSPEIGDLFEYVEHVIEKQRKRSPSRERMPPPPAPRRPCVDKAPLLPYSQRAIVRPKPVDPLRPFRHCGLMREIGGVDGFMKVERGTHRLAEEWETVSELVF